EDGLRWAVWDRGDPAESADAWPRRCADSLERFLCVRDLAPAEQFLDVSYDDTESAPIATIERIYDFLGWPLMPEARAAMERHLAANPKNKHGVHRYSLAEYGLDRDTELARFRAYCDRFAIPVQTETA